MYKKKNRAKIMDLEKFFDTVCQNKLIEILSRNIKEGRGISMIYNNLNVVAVQHSVFEHSEQKNSVIHISKAKYIGYGFYRYKVKCRLKVHVKVAGQDEETPTCDDNQSKQGNKQ